MTEASIGPGSRVRLRQSGRVLPSLLCSSRPTPSSLPPAEPREHRLSRRGAPPDLGERSRARIPLSAMAGCPPALRSSTGSQPPWQPPGPLGGCCPGRCTQLGPEPRTGAPQAYRHPDRSRHSASTLFAGCASAALEVPALDRALGNVLAFTDSRPRAHWSTPGHDASFRARAVRVRSIAFTRAKTPSCLALRTRHSRRDPRHPDRRPVRGWRAGWRSARRARGLPGSASLRRGGPEPGRPTPW
jgi:hypothetical protein